MALVIVSLRLAIFFWDVGCLHCLSLSSARRRWAMVDKLLIQYHLKTPRVSCREGKEKRNKEEKKKKESRGKMQFNARNQPTGASL